MTMFICALLLTVMIFLHSVESSPMPMQPHARLRVYMPHLPSRPELAVQDGRIVGIYYNGVIYKAVPVEPAPSPPVAGSQDLPDGSLLYRDGILRGRVQQHVVHDLNGQPILRLEDGDLVTQNDNIIALYYDKKFLVFQQNVPIGH